MFLWKTIDVAENERVMVYRRRRFETVLGPGRSKVSLLGGMPEFVKHDITQRDYRGMQGQLLFNSYKDQLSEYLEEYELKDTEVGLLYENDHMIDILAPGSYRLMWKSIQATRLEIFDISKEFEIPKELIGFLGRGVKANLTRAAQLAIQYVEVPDEHVGMLMVNGKKQSTLMPGSYGYWKFNRAITVKLVDMRLQNIEVSGQEILTKDRVSLRINLSASYKVKDPDTVVLKLNDFNSFVYRELQLRLREAVGTKSLDELLEDKNSLNQVIATDVRDKLLGYGVELTGVGVKDIILPGDMKTILNQVVEAQKEAEANVIKRREETQAMRSLHNTAKLMENNPVLLRLKELESLERVTGKIDKLSVYGGLEGLMTELVKLRPGGQ